MKGRTYIAIALLLVLVMAMLSACSYAESLTGTKTATIDRGGYKSFSVGGQGDIAFSVNVVEGGNVDVYVCDSPPMLGSLEYIDGYDYVNVEYVEDSFPRDDDNTMFIVVDNGDDVGTASTGDVTVIVEWATEKVPPPEDSIKVLPVALIVGFFVALIVVVLVLRTRRNPDLEPEVVVETIYLDERGRQVAPPAPTLSAQDRWCPRCGSERRINPATGWPYCPSCTPPPPPS